jgi:hypothetical protein
MPRIPTGRFNCPISPARKRIARGRRRGERRKKENVRNEG